jgi:hypothetical protein
MATVVLCGPAHSAPDLLAGPFDTDEDAADWIADQLAEPGRYMVAAELRSPQDVAG